MGVRESRHDLPEHQKFMLHGFLVDRKDQRFRVELPFGAWFVDDLEDWATVARILECPKILGSWGSGELTRAFLGSVWPNRQ